MGLAKVCILYSVFCILYFRSHPWPLGFGKGLYFVFCIWQQIVFCILSRWLFFLRSYSTEYRIQDSEYRIQTIAKTKRPGVGSKIQNTKYRIQNAEPCQTHSVANTEFRMHKTDYKTVPKIVVLFNTDNKYKFVKIQKM